MKVCLISLGCDKNLVDSEYMLGLLQKGGHTFTDVLEEAEAIVINTCCFIGDAKEESIRTILEMAQYKKTGSLKKLIVAGCLSQRYEKEIRGQLPEVDAVLGTASFEDILPALLAPSGYVSMRELSYLPLPECRRVPSAENYVSYLKIAEGCDKRCTYCVIPRVRGNYRSVPMERLLEEAKELARQGTKELIVIAQETTLYGVDIYGKKMLPKLLQELCKIEELSWIRLMYCYPEEITEELIAVLQKEPKVCKYLDLPIQHASDAILRAMGRRTTKAEISARIARLRKAVPGIALRTSLIVGFPGETEEDLEILLSALKEWRLERVGVFPYSKEEGTPAAKMKPQLTKRIKEQRRKQVMLLQQKISAAFGASLVGSVQQVLVEGYLPAEEVYVGRTYRDAPGVDGNVFFPSDCSFLSGDIVPVYITEANEYDLIGEVAANEFTE